MGEDIKTGGECQKDRILFSCNCKESIEVAIDKERGAEGDEKGL